MSLNKRQYIKYDEKSDIRKEFEKELGYEISEIRSEEGYWRKANAIHKWFVDNVQDGIDNCGTYYVTIENLEKLLMTVNAVLANNKLAESLLPTQEGFFFGPVEYDEYYFGSLEETKEILEKALSQGSKYDFYYHSSW